MTPISLTIKGLYSYQQETTIDFSILTAAGLFGIFGAVGSGKSTILEAISFALYGDTERLNSRESRSYNMMNLKSNTLLIDFVFVSGVDETKYKFTASARRNKKKFEDVSAFDRKAYIYRDAWQPIAVNAEEILGLSYDNFKRTIIIPQGKFQEFLQLKETERVQMLKEIFNLGKFELGNKVQKLSKQNDLVISNMQGQMLTLPEYNEEVIKEKQSGINVLNLNVNNLEISIKEKTEAEIQLQNIQSYFEEVNNKSASLNELKKQEPTINELEKKVVAYEKCQLLFKAPLDIVKTVRQQVKIQKGEVDKLLADKAIITVKLSEVNEQLSGLKPQYERKELLLQKAEELGKIINLKTLLAQIDGVTVRINNGKDIIDKELQHLQTLTDQLTILKATISEQESKIPDTSLLVRLSNWYNKRNELNAISNKTNLRLAEHLKKVLSVKEEIQNKIQPIKELTGLSEMPETIFRVNEWVEKTIIAYDQSLQLIKSALDHLRLSKKLEAFASTLTDAEACPLCGSTHHPNIYSAESVTEELEEKQQAVLKLEEKKEKLQTTLRILSGSYANYETLSNQFIQTQTELQQQKAELEKFTDTFSFDGYSITDENRVKQQLIEVEEQNNTLKRLKAERDAQEIKVTAADKKVKEYKQLIEGLINEKAKYEGQVETLKTQVVLHDFSSSILITANDLNSMRSTLQTNYETIIKSYELAQVIATQSTNSLSGLEGRLEELKKQIVANVDQQEKLEKQIADLLVQEGHLSEQAVANILSIEIDIKKERSVIETFKKAIHVIEVQLKEAYLKVEGKTYNVEAHQLLKDSIGQLKTEWTTQSEQLIKGKHDLEDLKTKMQLRNTLQQELDKLVLRAENLKVINNLFRSSGFVNYVSSVYLQNLVNSANERFNKMTRQKLSLELDENNGFIVRDFMNDGQTRNVKTLSGGQTFQAALSLALALADNIQHLTKSNQNFFFLDEGFGSLDKDALAIVFDTLKSLRKENRIVGVISHVDEMQQEIPINLKVVNDASLGSIISNSWNQSH